MRKYFYDITVKNWLIIGVFNLLIVATFGLLMRLKIILPLPFVDQQHLMHAHSHFAFSGWLSQVLMVLIVIVFRGGNAKSILPHRYQILFWGNLVASYGMLATFTWQGYGTYSIAFSTLTILLSYAFALLAWKDISMSSLSVRTQIWFKAALVFLVLSSIGTFYLAYLMNSGNIDPRRQLAAIYFYLHFQYNGWFFLMCMGLASSWFHLQQIKIRYEKLIQVVFVLGCVPAYMLSILWYDIPMVLYIVLIAVVILQIFAWAVWLRSIRENRIALKKIKNNSTVKLLLYAVILAASIKLVLQAFSVIPSLSVMAYSFRPIVIGYLHLVLLGVITLSLLAYAFQTGIFSTTRLAHTAVIGFVSGIVFNEILLMAQGAGGFAGIYIPHIPIALTGAAVIMVVSLILMFCTILYTRKHG